MCVTGVLVRGGMTGIRAIASKRGFIILTALPFFLKKLVDVAQWEERVLW